MFCTSRCVTQRPETCQGRHRASPGFVQRYRLQHQTLGSPCSLPQASRCEVSRRDPRHIMGAAEQAPDFSAARGIPQGSQCEAFRRGPRHIKGITKQVPDFDTVRGIPQGSQCEAFRRSPRHIMGVAEQAPDFSAARGVPQRGPRHIMKIGEGRARTQRSDAQKLELAWHA